MIEAFETFAWLDRTSAHRVRWRWAERRDVGASTSALLVGQYHAAVQLDDDEVAAFLFAALEVHVGPSAAVRLVSGDGAR